METSLFITGIGTDVGKTFISGLILKKILEKKIDIGYYKPVLSGLDETGLSDIEYVKKISSTRQTLKTMNTYSFKAALSPHLAAKLEGENINLDKIIRDYNINKKTYKHLILEGAGGIICPYNIEDDIFQIDLIKELNLDLLIVSNAKLGSLNNLLLTIDYINKHNINIRGVIINNYENNTMENDNIKIMEKYGGIKVLAKVKRNDKDIDIEIDKLLGGDEDGLGK